jgi:nucleotide-binding universal stress UspA family protein
MGGEKDMFQFKKILVPLDGSEFAESALEPALAIAKAMAAEVVLFRVAQPIPRTRALAEMPGVYNDVVAATYREAEDYLQELYAQLSYDKASIQYKPASDAVADLILDYAVDNGFDLIVMSSHGHSGVKRWVHGSVAEKVLRGAPCATLVIRGEQCSQPGLL